jgi:gliding motility-associated-like protein
MKQNKNIFLLLFFIAFTPVLKSQIDTLFWFAAPYVTADHDSNYPMALRISSFANATAVRIQQPASSYDTTISIPANSLFSKSLTHIVDSLESGPPNQVLRTGFKISSDFPITVVYDFISDTISGATGNNPETYSLKGQNGMGTEFVTPFQTKWYNRTLTADRNGDGIISQPYSFFSVCATEDSTVVYITPRCAIVGHAAGVTFSVLLDKGEVYTAQNATQATNVTGQNLSGSIVVANKPVTVTVSDDSVQPGGVAGCTCFDLMGDQIVPTDVIGKEYIVNKGFLNACAVESVFFVAVENFTTVTVDDGVTTTTYLMNQGDTRDFPITQNLTHLISDKSIYVTHMSGYGCELGFAIIPPLNCSGSDQVSFSRNNNQSFLLNILCPAGTEGAFLLDGSAALVPASSFTVVPATGGAWVGAQISFTTAQLGSNSAHFIQNTMDNFSLGIINGGASSGCLYHYMSSFLRRVYTNAGNDLTVCTSSNAITISGSVTGGSTTGMWSVLNGTGSFGNINDLVTTYTPSSSDTAQGTVTLVLGSTGNCIPVTDTLVINFEKSPAVNAGGDITLCENNLGTINLTGSLAYAAGATWSGGNGAFSNPGALNTVYTASPADLANDSIYLTLTSAGSFFGCPDVSDSIKIIFTPAPAVNAGPDFTVCANNANVTLAGAVSGASTSGVWTTNGSGVFSPDNVTLNASYIPSSTDTALGNITITLTSTNNGTCNSVSDSIDITIVNAPTVYNNTIDIYCANIGSFPVTGNVTSGFGVQWSTTGFGSFSNPNTLNTTYTLSPLDTAQGDVWLTLSTVAGLCNSVSDSIQIFLLDPPQVYAGADQTYCANQAVQLNGVVWGVTFNGAWTSTGTGSFTPDDSLLTTAYIPSPGDLGAGGVDLILTSIYNQGCNAENDTLKVLFIAPPNATFSVTEVCFGQSTNFTDVSTVFTGTVTSWNYDFGDFTNSSAQNPVHNYPAPGTYTATLIVGASNGCYDTTQNTVIVNALPVADFTFTLPCEDAAIAFTDNSIMNPGTIASWNYTFGDASANSTLQDPTHIYSTAGTFPVTLQIVSDKGCTDNISYNVNVLPAPIANFVMSDNPVVALESVSFTDQSYGGPFSGWIWSFGDTTGANVQNPSHSYSTGGTYSVSLVVTDQNGCMDTTSHEIVVALLPVLPTAFTPNGDNNNDVFFVRGGPFKSLVFKVYNNWGELLFSTTDQTQGWDGKYLDVEQPMGVYVWTADVEIADGRTIKKSGDVTLIR